MNHAVIGCFGTALSILSFGLSRHVPAMIVTRALSGVLNGNVSVIVRENDQLYDSKKLMLYPPLESSLWRVDRLYQ